MPAISERITATETSEVKTVERIEDIHLTRGFFTITFGVFTVLADGTELRQGSTVVRRARPNVSADTVTLGAQSVTAAQGTTVLVRLAEKWRAEDVAAAEAAAAATATAIAAAEAAALVEPEPEPTP